MGQKSGHGLAESFSSVAQSYATLCNPMNCSTPGLPVHHQLPEFTQTHVHRVGDAIQDLILRRPLLLPPSIPLSIRVFSSESTLCMKCSLVFRVNFLSDWLAWSFCCPRESQESSATPQFKSINSSALCLLYGWTLTSTHDCWKHHRFE